MDAPFEQFKPSELRPLIIAEINKLIYLLENNAPLIDIVEKRVLIREIYEQLDKKEREEFISLFGENFLHEPLHNITKNPGLEKK